MAERLEDRSLLSGAYQSYNEPYSNALAIAKGQDGYLYVASFEAGVGTVLTKVDTDGTTVATYDMGMATDPTGGYSIAVASDGAVWVAEFGRLGRLAPDGTISQFDVPSTDPVAALAAGPDGSVDFISDGEWALDSQMMPQDAPVSINRMTPDGQLTSIPLGPWLAPDTAVIQDSLIAAGPDGSAAFTVRLAGDQEAIDTLAADGTVGQFTLPAGTDEITSLTYGPDGNLWYIQAPNYSDGAIPGELGPMVGQITPSGTVTTFAFTPTIPYSVGLDASLTRSIEGIYWQAPNDLVSAPDGNLYFLDNGVVDQVTTDGVITSTSVPLDTNPYTVTFVNDSVEESSVRSQDVIGPDGNLWIAIDASGAEPGLASFNLSNWDGSPTSQDPSSPTTPPTSPTTPPTSDPSGPPGAGSTVNPGGPIDVQLPIVVSPVLASLPIDNPTPVTPTPVSLPATQSSPAKPAQGVTADPVPVLVGQSTPKATSAPAARPSATQETPSVVDADAGVLIPLMVVTADPTIGQGISSLSIDTSQPLGHPKGLDLAIGQS